MEQKSYSPSLLAADENVVYALIENLKELLLTKIGSEHVFVSANYPVLWELVHIENTNEYVVLLHIDWPEQAEPVSIHFKQNQWKFLPEIVQRDTLGLMFDFHPETNETSGVLMLVEINEGLPYIIEQLPDI